MKYTLYRLILCVVLSALAIITLYFIANLGHDTMAGSTGYFLFNPAAIAVVFVTTVLAAFISCLWGISPDVSISGDRTAGRDKKAREQGTVKWFNVIKGYGFVTRANGEEIFAHCHSIRSTHRRSLLREGRRVEYRVTQGEKGLQAEDVEPVVTGHQHTKR